MALVPAIGIAHDSGAPHAPTLAAAWSGNPLVLVALSTAVLMYAAGLARYWRRAGLGRGVRGGEAAAHGAGLATLFLTLVWPLDALGEWSLAAHMAQHMLLIAVAAPLLLLGRPGVVWLAALPKSWTRRATWPLRQPWGRSTASSLTGTTTAALLQALVMWGWHLPAAMELALTHDAVHYAMHGSFLAAGLLFWWALLRSLREPRIGFSAGFVALIGTMVQMGLLGALLTFAPTPRFEFYIGRVEPFGLTALEDQQLAGLIMWVPSALPYLIGVLALTALWLQRSERTPVQQAARGRSRDGAVGPPGR